LLETASSTAAADVYEQAIASLERALELSPGFAKAALMLAGMQVEAGRTEHAIITLQRALVEAGAADATPIRRELQMLQRSKGKANLPP
jgi:tetratricopeptide (TPR) repeat protein